MDWGRDSDACQLKAILLTGGDRLVCESQFVKGRKKEIAGAVPREHLARPVTTVGCRRKANDQNCGIGRSEAGDGASPVCLLAKGRPFLYRDLFPPFNQSGACPTGRNKRIQFG